MLLKIIDVASSADCTKLWEFIPKDYLSDSLMELLRKYLSDSIRSIAVEYPYVDKDYRSTYYGFYSKRHRTYDKFCFRLHFFIRQIASEASLNEAGESYLGSMVLRPTEVATLGRTLLSPRAIKGFEGYICEAAFKNNLYGVDLPINTFPHIMQDTDVTVCAHAVCWMIARYYSERYCVYPERLTYDIACAIKDVSFGRTIPSRGITLGQVSEVLNSIGFHPELFIRQLYKDDEPDFFHDILYSYVESGIPVVAAMHKKEHAVAILGHGVLLSAVDTVKALDWKKPFLPARRCCPSFVINDDNRLPFSFIHAGEGSDDSYRLSDVDGFAVPLYEKMYLSADNILKIYPNWASGNLVKLEKAPTYVSRVFMTSSRSYKRSLTISQDMDPLLRKAQIDLPMPKFIWIIELSEPLLYDQKRVNYRWVVDATANPYEKFPFLLIHDSEKMIIYDRTYRDKIYEVKFTKRLSPFAIFENNLRRYT